MMGVMGWMHAGSDNHLVLFILIIQGVPKKMFPCLRGYNSCKKGATIKSKVSFEILRQFSF